MRILMVSEDLPAQRVGGLGKHVVTLANALLDQGHEVAILGRSDVDYEACRAEIGFHGSFIPGFSFEHAGWKEAHLGVWMPYKRPSLAARIERAIASQAAAFDVVHYHGHLPMVGLGLPSGLPLLQTRHDQGSECLTHVRFFDGAVCEQRSPRACARCMTPRPNVLQQSISAWAVDQYRARVDRNFAQRPTLFVSEFLRRQFLLAAPDAQLGRTEVIHNFIDLGRLARLSAGQAPVPGTVVMVGRIDEAKGFGSFLEAWSRAGQPGEVHIVGEGPVRGSLQQRYDGLAKFHGWQPYDAAVQMTARAHVCVVPSVWQEPCGTTILEALALGRPCLALSRGGTPELQRYERYPGQLQLADDMAGLVQLLSVMLADVAQHRPVPASHAADVASVVPTVLKAYERTRLLAAGP